MGRYEVGLHHPQVLGGAGADTHGGADRGGALLLSGRDGGESPFASQRADPGRAQGKGEGVHRGSARALQGASHDAVGSRLDCHAGVAVVERRERRVEGAERLREVRGARPERSSHPAAGTSARR